MHTTQFGPNAGAAFQGDVVVMPLPADIHVVQTDEIAMRGDMLVFAEGEVTGHHHAIRYGLEAASRFRDDGLARQLEAKASPAVAIGTARLFRDPSALAELCRRGILVTDALCIGFLIVEGDCPPLTHDEHAPIKIPAGSYYVGAKREMDAASERRVAD